MRRNGARAGGEGRERGGGSRELEERGGKREGGEGVMGI